MIAEARTSKAIDFVTLTYGRDEKNNSDHVRANVLTYSDAQKFIKRMRKKYNIRYFIAGEYGDEKGRAHWHVIIYWQGERPKIEMNKNINHPMWPHGFSMWKKAHTDNMKYCAKYTLKEQSEDGKQAKFGYSKFPPLGAEYFDNMAEQNVRHGIIPDHFDYYFPEVKRSTVSDQKMKFRMIGVTQTNYIEALIKWWKKIHPKRHMPTSEIVEEYLDKQVKTTVEKVPDPKPIDHCPEPWYQTETDRWTTVYRDGKQVYWIEKDQVYQWQRNGVTILELELQIQDDPNMVVSPAQQFELNKQLQSRT
jgi:hypothetical protein